MSPSHSALPVVAGGPSILDRQITLAELLDLRSFQQVCESFVDLYKIGIKIFDRDHNKLVDVREGSDDWCGFIFANPTGRQRCTQLVTRVKSYDYPELEGGEIVEQHCFSGLKYVIMPITYAGELLGRVIYGPFLPADRAEPGAEVRSFPGFDADALWELRSTMRRAPDETVQRILANFRQVIDAIVAIAYKALMTQHLHLESVTSSYRELEQANQRLQSSIDKLEELDRLKASFLAMISHELRTPLTAIIGFSDLLLEGMAGDLEEEANEFVGTIKERGQELLGLIGSLLDLSRIESGAVPLSLTEVSAKEVVELALRAATSAAQKKGVHLQVLVEDGLPDFSADREKLVQSIAHLLSNAVKFTQKGGRVEVRAARFTGMRRYSGSATARFGAEQEDFVRIDVADDGIGIPSDQLERVFQPFYQVDNSSTRSFGGTGLGLALVKSFVEAHEGEVWVESAPGKGARFSLLLPRASAPLPRF